MSGIYFEGVFSGLSTDSIVNALLERYRAPINTLEERKTWYDTVRSAISEAKRRTLKLQDCAMRLKWESTFLARSGTSSAPGLVDVEVQPGAPVGTHTIKVDSVARGGRAISGLNDRGLNRTAVFLAPGNRINILSLEPVGTYLSVAASGNTLIKDLDQAGTGEQKITAGDKILITGTKKDGSSVNAEFVFNGDATDTLDRLKNAIVAAFGGDVSGEIDERGRIVLTETDPSTPGDITLSLSFQDADGSGSTLDLGTLTNFSGTTTPVKRLVMSSTTFTEGTNSSLATTATDLSNLYQTSGGPLDTGDKIKIYAVKKDGTSVNAEFVYGVDGTTVGELVSFLNSASVFDSSDAVNGSTVSFSNGKFSVEDNTGGESKTFLALGFEDAGANSNSIRWGSFFVAREGMAGSPQEVRTREFTVKGVGEYAIVNRDGKGGSITGNHATGISEEVTLSSLGVTDFYNFTVFPHGAGSEPEGVVIRGLDANSTVGDLIDAINEQIDGVTARLVDVGGLKQLQIVANDPGNEVWVTDVAGGILDKVMNLGTSAQSSNSTSDVDDYTMTAVFTSKVGNIYRTYRFVSVGDEGSPVEDLIPGVRINGAGSNTFTEGAALITQNSDSELNIKPGHAHYYYGGAGVSASNWWGPRLDTTRTLREAGFATPPTNVADSPLDHTQGFFTINGVRIEIPDVDTMTVDELIAEINASDAGVTAYYDEVNDRFVLKSKTDGPADIKLGGGGDTSNFLRIAKLVLEQGATDVAGENPGSVDVENPLQFAGLTVPVTSGVFTINGTKIYVDSTKDSLQDVIDKINKSGARVRAFYDSVSDRLVLEQVLEEGMEEDYIKVGDPTDTSNFLAAVGLTSDPHTTKEVGTKRERASFIFDGVDYVRDTNTITDLIPKATITLRGPTESYETITISADVDLMKERLADFVQAYNELVDFINPPPLTPEDEENMKPLSDEDAANMTVDEIEAYNARREELLYKKAILETGYFKNLYAKIQSLTVLPAGTSSMYESLSALDITSGSGGETAYDINQRRGKLLVDSTDRDEILKAIEDNPTIMDALTNHSDELYKLFGTTYTSKTSVVGTKSLSTVHLTGVLRFAIGAEGKWASIYMAPGFYTAGDVVNIINSELGKKGIETVRAYLDASNHVVVEAETDEGRAQFEVRELNDSVSLSDTLGLPSGGWKGEDVSDKTGLARRLESYLKNETGIRGIMYQYIKPGGLLDMKMDSIQRAIDIRNDWLAEEEERLRRMFINMEMWLGQYKSISAFIQQRTQSVSLLPGVSQSVQNQ